MDAIILPAALMICSTFSKIFKFCSHWLQSPLRPRFVSRWLINLLGGDSFNLDHVVLSSGGVFVIETKTYTKPIKGSPSVTFDRRTLLVNGFESERSPVNQVQGNARWLGDILHASTGKEFPVRPVVLFPGWFVEPFPKGSSVWVLNPQALPSFIEHEPIRIKESDLHMAAFHLARYMRAWAQGFSARTH